MGEMRKTVRASAEEKLERASRWIVKLQEGYDSHKKYVAEQAAELSYMVLFSQHDLILMKGCVFIGDKDIMHKIPPLQTTMVQPARGSSLVRKNP